MALSEIFDAVLDYDDDEVAELVEAELAAGTDPQLILEKGLVSALDVIGEKSVSAEAEVIAAAADALDALGLGKDDYRIRFSSRALLGELLSRLGIDSSHHGATFIALDKRGKIDDDAIFELLANEGLDAAATRQVFDLLPIERRNEALSCKSTRGNEVEELVAGRRDVHHGHGGRDTPGCIAWSANDQRHPDTAFCQHSLFTVQWII